MAIHYLPAIAALGVALCAELTTNALADIIEFKPVFGIEQIFTDNVRASADDRDADGVTVLTARLDAALRSSRINAIADVNVFYNEFWATDTLDSLNGAGTVAGRAEVLTGVFFIDAIAQKQDVYLSATDVSASGLSTGQGSLQQTNYGVSPFVTGNIFGLADLLVRGNYAQVLFDRPVVGVAATLLTDITVKSVAGKITTGERASLYEAVATAEYLETDLGFEQRNVIGGLILNLTKGLSAIGRIGYERISDPSFPLIHGTIWSLGGRYRFSDASFIQFEYGKRFEDDTFLAEFNVALTSRVRVVGNYTDTLVPVQLTLVRGVQDLLDQEGNFVITAPNSPSIPDPTLVDAIVRDKDLKLGATFEQDLQVYTLTVGHTERFYPSLLDDESFYFVGVSLEEKLSRSLDYLLSVQFQDNYSVLATANTSQIFRTELSFTYQYTQDVAFAGGYTWRLETNPDNNDTYENVLRFSVSQAF
ncbi:MAG: hypothetical protein K8S25_13915 [Alphaproteobacteria bacterium]|nr:hypothetical protein [Alphaproteobacteria bacterium]